MKPTFNSLLSVISAPKITVIDCPMSIVQVIVENTQSHVFETQCICLQQGKTHVHMAPMLTRPIVDYLY